MSTSSNSTSLRFLATSWTHFATASPFRFGRVLPIMIAILSISSSLMVSENDSVTLLLQPLCRNTLLPKTGESGADAQEHNDPKHRHDESQRQAAREHQYVNEQNVNDDRSEQRQREWDVATNQEQDRRNDLEQKYRDQIMGDKEGADELASRSGGRRTGNEVEEAIQSKNEKDESKKETGDDSYNFHVSFVCL